jgi:uncharacterized protein YodC (DUF2158 family)
MDNTIQFNVGDQVCFKAGGPLMTVERVVVRVQEKLIVCIYFEQDRSSSVPQNAPIPYNINLKRQDFSVQTLCLVNNRRESNIQIGDVVTLQSGGPQMVVESLVEDRLSCVLLDENGNKKYLHIIEKEEIVLWK